MVVRFVVRYTHTTLPQIPLDFVQIAAQTAYIPILQCCRSIKILLLVIPCPPLVIDQDAFQRSQNLLDSQLHRSIALWSMGDDVMVVRTQVCDHGLPPCRCHFGPLVRKQQTWNPSHRTQCLRNIRPAIASTYFEGMSVTTIAVSNTPSTLLPRCLLLAI